MFFGLFWMMSACLLSVPLTYTPKAHVLYTTWRKYKDRPVWTEFPIWSKSIRLFLHDVTATRKKLNLLIYVKFLLIHPVPPFYLTP